MKGLITFGLISLVIIYVLHAVFFVSGDIEDRKGDTRILLADKAKAEIGNVERDRKIAQLNAQNDFLKQKLQEEKDVSWWDKLWGTEEIETTSYTSSANPSKVHHMSKQQWLDKVNRGE